MKSSVRVHYILVFVFFMVTYGYFFQGGNWNQNTRICLTRSIVDSRTFTIDRYAESVDSGKYAYYKFLNAGDWAFYNGNYYINKTPGLSFLAVPPFAAAQYALKRIFPGNEAGQVLLSTYFSTVCTVGLCGALLCVLIFYAGHQLFQCTKTKSLLLALLFGLGTLTFSYGTTFYCHVPAAFFSFLSFVLAADIRHNRCRRTNFTAFLAGCSAALAVLIEPSAVFCLGFVLFYLLISTNGRRYAFIFLMGCAPFGLIQCLYNTACFGGPFSLSYSYSNPEVMFLHNGRFFSTPRPGRALKLLISPYRGLFFFCPVLLMALPGLYYSFKNKCFRTECVLCAAVCLCFVLLIAGFQGWHGGNSVGPRYLVPMIPFAFFPAACAMKRRPGIFIAVGILSAAMNLSVAAVGNEFAFDIKNPFFEVILRQITQNNVSVNPVPISGYERYADYSEGFPNFDKMFVNENWTRAPLLQNFNSFNLGELLFPHQLASLLPLFCFWAAWGGLWRKTGVCRRT